MSSNHRIDLFRRLSFRLTLWYGLVFTICGVVLLLIFFHRVAQVTREAVDEELTEELAEYAELMQTRGISGVISEMAAEVAAEAPGTLFLSLFSAEGDVLASTDTRAWGGPIPMPAGSLAELANQDEMSLDTLDLDSHPCRLRNAYQTIGPGVRIQVGISLAESEAYLKHLPPAVDVDFGAPDAAGRGGGMVHGPSGPCRCGRRGYHRRSHCQRRHDPARQAISPFRGD